MKPLSSSIIPIFLFLSCFFLFACEPSAPKTSLALAPEAYEENATHQEEAFELATIGGNFLVNYTDRSMRSTAGRINCLAIDYADSMHLIAGSASGGIWVSNDRGTSWTALNDFAQTLNVNSISQDPFNHNNYLYSSLDIIQGSSNTFRPGIFQSTDGGATFNILAENVSTSFTKVPKIAYSPVHPNVVYAISDISATVGGMRLFRSVDGGSSFDAVYQSAVIGGYFKEFHLLADSAVLVVDDDEIYRSPSGDSGTFVMANGLHNNGTFDELRISSCKSQPNVVYALATGGSIYVGVFKSVDGGLNWTYTGNLGFVKTTRSSIAVKPDNPDWVLAGSVTMNLTQNGGTNWQNYQVSSCLDYRYMTFDPHNPNIAYVCYDQGIARYNLNPFEPIAANAATLLDSSIRNTQIHAADYSEHNDDLLLGLQDLGTWVVYNDSNFTRHWGGDGGYCFFHQQDSTVAYMSAQSGNTVRKENLHVPASGSPIDILNQLDTNNNYRPDDGHLFIHPFWVNYADGDQLYFPTNKKLWRSVDRGDNWVPISNDFLENPGTLHIEGSHQTNPNVYWAINDSLYCMSQALTAGIGDERIVKTPYWVNSIRVAPDNDSIVYITCNTTSTNCIYRSSNLFLGNVTWTPIPTSSLPNGLWANCVEVNPNNLQEMVFGTDKGLYTTSNGGLSWQKELCFPNVRVKSSKIRHADNKLYFFTYGRGAWSADFPSNVVPTKIIEKPTEATFFVWPNPARNVLNIGMEELLPASTFTVYGMDGKTWMSLPVVTQNPSALSVQALPAGSYVLQWTANGKVLGTQQFIKQ